jgi:Flp pilus assembly pilin Flp
MFNQLMIAKNHVQSFIQDKKGAVAFEYVLIIGGVSVVVIGLLTIGANAMFPQLISATCVAMSSILPSSASFTC